VRLYGNAAQRVVTVQLQQKWHNAWCGALWMLSIDCGRAAAVGVLLLFIRDTIVYSSSRLGAGTGLCFNNGG
jgi:hypothetical protein